jgi:hypothetical protein
LGASASSSLLIAGAFNGALGHLTFILSSYPRPLFRSAKVWALALTDCCCPHKRPSHPPHPPPPSLHAHPPRPQEETPRRTSAVGLHGLGGIVAKDELSSSSSSSSPPFAEFAP